MESKKKQPKKSARPAPAKQPKKHVDGGLPDAELDKIAGGYIEQDNLKKPHIEQDRRPPR